MKNESYFRWIAECCTLLGKDKMYGALLITDTQWAEAFKDEMTAAEAVAEFKETYPNGYPKEIEDKYL